MLVSRGGRASAHDTLEPAPGGVAGRELLGQIAGSVRSSCGELGWLDAPLAGAAAAALDLPQPELLLELPARLLRAALVHVHARCLTALAHQVDDHVDVVAAAG
jgi:hypothetical protein